MTRETLFNLTHGIEVVIPIEIGVTSMRWEFFDEKGNDHQLKMNFDCLDEVRIEASQKIVKCQQNMAGYYNQRAKLRRFNEILSYGKSYR